MKVSESIGRRLNCTLRCAILIFLSGCGTASRQNVYAQYILGRVNFTDRVPPQSGVSVVIEYSSNNFTTIQGSTSVSNSVGLLTVPYNLGFATGTADYVQFRAFADTNGNGTWDAGEGTGRFDNTDTGNSTLVSLTRVVGAKCPSGYDASSTSNTCQQSFFAFITGASATSSTHYMTGGNISLDTSSAQ